MNINSETRVCGVIGCPVEHSLSPLMHNAAFRSLNLNYVYTALRVESNHLRAAVAGLKALGFRGVNVTIPHKLQVVQYLDELDPYARKAKAVNTILNRDGRLIGYNTDGVGALRSLREGGCDPRDKKVLIVGTGGAARSIAFALVSKARELLIMGRSRAGALGLTRDLREESEVEIRNRALSSRSLRRAVRNTDILINATSVGMWPDTQHSIIYSKDIPSHIAVFEVVYNPARTKLLEQAEEAGARTISGIGMLVHQGAEAFRIWTGRAAPIEVMRKAILSELSRRDSRS